MPSYLIAALVRTGVRDLTVTSNLGGLGLEMLAQVREKMRAMIGFPEDFYDVGVLAERGRSAKASLPSRPRRA